MLETDHHRKVVLNLKRVSINEIGTHIVDVYISPDQTPQSATVLSIWGPSKGNEIVHLNFVTETSQVSIKLLNLPQRSISPSSTIEKLTTKQASSHWRVRVPTSVTNRSDQVQRFKSHCNLIPSATALRPKLYQSLRPMSSITTVTLWRSIVKCPHL